MGLLMYMLSSMVDVIWSIDLLELTIGDFVDHVHLIVLIRHPRIEPELAPPKHQLQFSKLLSLTSSLSYVSACCGTLNAWTVSVMIACSETISS